MIKLEIEIKDERFIYSYRIGKDRQHSSSSLTGEQLSAFTELLKMCLRVTLYGDSQLDKELQAKAWIERHQDEAEKFIEEKLKNAHR